MSRYDKALRAYRPVTTSAEITPEWMDALPGRFRPPPSQPHLRWLWDNNLLAADGVSSLEGIAAPRPRTQAQLDAGDSHAK